MTNDIENFCETSSYRIERGELATSLVEIGSPVPYVALLPPGYDSVRLQPYPLLLHLHGGAGLAEGVLMLKPLLEKICGNGGAQFVAVSFSCPGRHPKNIAGGQYIDYHDGSQNWARFIVEDFLPYIQNRYRVGNNNTGKNVIMGVSMGGAGTLRISLRHPELFVAAAALEPHIHGALSYCKLNHHQRAIETPHDRPPLDGDDGGYTGDICGIIRDEAYGVPVNDNHWRSWQPSCIAIEDQEKIINSSLQIYLECGDRDEFEFNFATEHLHRVLIDLGIEHDYHLLRGVGHYGADMDKRLLNALEFLSKQVLPAEEESEEYAAVQRRCAWDTLNRKRAAGYIEQTVSEKYRGVCGSFVQHASGG